MRLGSAGAARASQAGAQRNGVALRKGAGSRLREGRFRDVRERVPAAGRRRADSAGQAGVAVGGARASSKAVMAPYSQSSRKLVLAKRRQVRRAVRTMCAAVRIT